VGNFVRKIHRFIFAIHVQIPPPPQGFLPARIFPTSAGRDMVRVRGFHVKELFMDLRRIFAKLMLR
jgi:hypothetical protein